MRIAMCTDQYVPQLGGVADSVHTLALELRKQGHIVRVFAPDLTGAAQDPDTVRFRTLSFKGMFNLVAPFGMLEALRAFKPDVIHAQAVGIATVNAIRCARRLGVPVVATYHGAPADYLRYFHLDFWPFPILIHKLTSRFFDACDAVTAPAKTPLGVLRRFGTARPRMEVISNPVTLNLFRPLADKEALRNRFGISGGAVMLFGRIAAEKNLGVAARVFAAVAKQSAAQLIVIGDGPSRPDFEQMLRELGVYEQVRFLGRLSGDALVEHMNCCDVMLTTSLTEAQPMTVLQAAACGIPVVGANAGGVPDCIVNEKTGYIVDPSDIDDFASRVIELLNNTERARAFGENAQRFVAQYAPENVASKFAALYEEIRLISDTSA